MPNIKHLFQFYVEKIIIVRRISLISIIYSQTIIITATVTIIVRAFLFHVFVGGTIAFVMCTTVNARC